MNNSVSGLLIFFVLLVVNKSEADAHRRYNIEGTEGHALLGTYTFLNLTDPAMHIGRCLATCLQDCRCISFQICQAIVCQLCSTSQDLNPEAYRKAEECSHFVFKNDTAKRFLCDNGELSNHNATEEYHTTLPTRPTTLPTIARCSTTEALGMESGEIPDSAVMASSIYNADYQAYYGRLNKNLGGGSWAADTPLGSSPGGSPSDWLEVDMSGMANITTIATQGGAKHLEWVTKYNISYMSDNGTWQNYSANETFSGNSDQTTVVTNYFNPSIIARYVRIVPLEWNRYASLRIEYYGCRLNN